jgi:ferric-dicitrate binding protein FerR (iron transport regulator)
MNNDRIDDINLDSAGIDELRKILFDLVEGKLSLTTKEDKETLQKQLTLRIETLVATRVETMADKLRADNRRIRRNLFLGLAASFIVAVFCVAGIFYISRQDEGVFYNSLPGEISKIIVGGATIHVNSDTKLHVRETSSKSHAVTLENGEIYIDNPKGEYFEIFTDDKVAVFFNGNVDVLSRSTYNKITSLNADIKVRNGDTSFTIKPNQQFRTLNGKSSTSYLRESGNVGMFAKEYLYFDGDPFSYVRGEISRAYRLTIVSENNKIDSILVSGMFSMKTDPIEILRQILPPPYSVTINGNTIQIEDGVKRNR